ncbi:hypothetical protein Hanom_Chr17g01526131 [Helianthus anomalus]
MGVVGLKKVNRTEESSPQSSDFFPMDGEHQTGIEKSKAHEGAGLHDCVHGNQSNSSGSFSKEVGPEENHHEEREFGGFGCSNVGTGKKKKRRPKVKTPLRDRPNSSTKSPSEEERPNKRPRASSSDPFDLDRFIENWKSLSEACNNVPDNNLTRKDGDIDLNQTASAMSTSDSTQLQQTVGIASSADEPDNQRGVFDPAWSCFWEP